MNNLIFLDRLVLTIGTGACIFAILFMAHEYGKKSLCKELGGMYSFHYSKCMNDIKQIEIK